MNVTLYQTQDPWMDIGLVAFYDALDFICEEDPDLFLKEPELTPGFLTFAIENEQVKNFQESLAFYIQEKINNILLPSAELKWLGNAEWTKKDERGFMNDQYKLTLTKEDIAFLKNQTNEKGNPIIKKPQKVAEVQCYRSYIGIKRDWRWMRDNYQEEVNHFIHQVFGKSLKKKKCPLCGREAETFFPMNQSRNVLFNQHHATPIRGYQSSVRKEKMCPVCNLLNLFATLQIGWIPYFVAGDVTHLLVPEVTNLSSLFHLMKTIGSNGLHQNLGKAKQVVTYQTNIVHLKHRTLYASLLQLYFWMNYVQKESGLMRSSLRKQDHIALRGWMIPRYSKGQNVIFKEFTRISIDEDLFSLTLLISWGSYQKVYEGDIVQDFINEIRSEDDRVLDRIAKGIIKKDIRIIAKNLFQLYKRSLNKPDKYNLTIRGSLFFKDYLPYFCRYLEKEEMDLFNDRFHEDLRLLGITIGQNTDLASMNKLNTAATVDTFVTAVKEALFKVYKQQLSRNKDKNVSDEIYNIGTKRMHNILSSLDKNNLFIIRDTLIIYASLSAFQTNNVKKKEKEKESIEE